MKKTEHFCWTWRQHEEFFNIYKILFTTGVSWCQRDTWHNTRLQTGSSCNKKFFRYAEEESVQDLFCWKGSAGELPLVSLPAFVDVLKEFGFMSFVGLLVSEPSSAAALLNLHTSTAVDVWREVELRKTLEQNLKDFLNIKITSELKKTTVCSLKCNTVSNHNKGYSGRRMEALWSRTTAPPWGGWGCWRCRSVWASGSRTPSRRTCRPPEPTCGDSSSSQSASPSGEQETV